MKAFWRKFVKRSFSIASESADCSQRDDNLTAATTDNNSLPQMKTEEREPQMGDQEPPRVAPVSRSSSHSSVVDVQDGHDKSDAPVAENTSLLMACSEQQLDIETSYCYGQQFVHNGGKFGYPMVYRRRRLAAIPVVKGVVVNDVDFPMFFSSYDMPVVSAIGQASYARRRRQLVELHQRHTSVPAARQLPRHSTRMLTVDSGERSDGCVGQER